MSPAEPAQVFVRNDQGKVWGPLTLQTVTQLIGDGSISGRVQVSEDGVNFASPAAFPTLQSVFPAALWGQDAAIPAAAAAAPRGAPIAGPGAMAAASVRTPAGAAARPGMRVFTAPAGEPVTPKASAPTGPAPVAAAAPRPAPPPPTSEQAAGPPPSGDLAVLGPLHLYYLAASTNVTGMLTFELSDRQIEIHFRKGNPEYLASSHPEDGLGVFLLRSRLATEEQLQQAEAEKNRFGGELLGALFGLGVLNPGAAFSQLAQRASALLLRALLAETGTFTFAERELATHRVMPLGNRWAVLGDAVRRVPGPELKRRLQAALDLPVMKSGGRVPANDLRLTPQEARALSYFDGVRSLNQLVHDIPADGENCLRLAFWLQPLECVSFAAIPTRARPVDTAPPPTPAPAEPPNPAPAAAPPRPAPPVAARPPPPVVARPTAPAPAPAKPTPAPAPPRTPASYDAELAELRAMRTKIAEHNHFQMLELSEKADGSAVKVAYFKLAKLYHPDTVPPDAPPELSKLKEELFSRIGEAYRVLADDKTRAEYIEHLAAGGGDKIDIAKLLAAEELFNKSCALIKARRYLEALKPLEEAIAGNPDEGEFYAWRGYATFFAAADRKQGLIDAQRDLELCFKRNERCAAAHYFLGHITRITGDMNGAMKHFKRCLEVQPDHIDAQRELRMMKK